MKSEKVSTKTITQNDVAKEAGVTRSMVSYVINGNSDRSVAPATKRRILDAIEKLGYRPNKAAQALQQGDVEFASNRIGVVLCNAQVFSRPYYADILSGIHTAAHENNYHVTFIRFFEELKDPVLFNELIHPEEVGGLILVSLDQCLAQEDDRKIIDSIKERVPNVVCVEWQYDGLCSIGFDRLLTAQKACDYLFTKGITDIAYIGEVDDRISGVERSFSNHGKNPLELKTEAAYTVPSGYSAAKKFLEENKLPQGFVCGSDEVAFGVMCWLNENKIDIPGQVAVISIDNIEMSGYTNPPLTTMNVQKVSMGARAVEMIVQNKGKSEIEAIDITLPTSIVERKSV